MKTLIVNGKILSPAPLPWGYAILIEDGRIAAVAPGAHVVGASRDFPADLPRLDAGGHWVVPGLIDIHVHGGSGSDTMDADPQALPNMARFFAERGVTSFLPTTVATSAEQVTAAIQRVGSYRQTSDGARVLGIHLEGPYLQHQYRGAQPPQHLRLAHPQEYLPWLESGLVKLFTVAPEIEGVLSLIERGSAVGVKFAVGHSAASYETMRDAVAKGLTQSTHTFNGMPPLHHREPGVIGAVLTETCIYAQVIADGVHLHPAVVKLVFEAKGVRRTVLITDAVRAAGAADGTHRLGDQIITVKDGIARTDSGSLAGSTLTMDQALRNAHAFTNRPWDELLPSATCVAAESLGLADQIGSLKPGAYADVVFMDEDFQPRLTMVAGEVVFQKK